MIQSHERQLVYLDHAAATPLHPQVQAKINNYSVKNFANPNSLHQWGRAAHNDIEVARQELADIIHANSSQEIIFTSSATESNNLALVGIMRAAHRKNPLRNHLIITQIEHDSNLQVAKALEKEGFRVTYLPVNKFGQIETQTLEKAIIPGETVLFSIVHGHYQFGTIQNLKKLSKICVQEKVLFHTDASQTFAKIKIDVQEMGIDLLTASAAKIYGPKSIGLLYIRSGLSIEPLIYGGGQEKGLRSSTLDPAAIMGFALAAQISSQNQALENERLCELRDYLIKRILTEIDHINLNGHPTDRLSNNAHFSIHGAEGESLLFALDAVGIAVSTGSACSSHNLQPDHSLLALGLGPAAAHGSLRISLGNSNDQAQIDYFIEQLKIIVARLRKLSPLDLDQKENK